MKQKGGGERIDHPQPSFSGFATGSNILPTASLLVIQRAKYKQVP